MNKGYKNLLIFKKAKSFCAWIYKIIENFLRRKIYGLTGQLKRDSVPISFLNHKLQTSNSFTLIETLVVIAITVILVAIIIGYSHIGEKQIALFRDQAKVISVLNRAKFLSVQMYQKELDKTEELLGVKVCGYGVHFGVQNNKRIFLIFRDIAIAEVKFQCNDKFDYAGNNLNFYLELVEKYELDSNFEFETDLTDIVFIPPDPFIKLNSGDLSEAIIKIKLDNNNFKEIKVTQYGQITAK